MLDWGLAVAIAALLISIISLLWNWRHSESLFRRTEYPAIAWYRPKVSKAGHNTVITTSICNYGTKNIRSIFFGAFLCTGFKSEAWCRSEPINEIPIHEELTFHITGELEKDVNERFGGLFYRDGWYFKGRTRRYKIIFRLEYQALIADTLPIVRKAYYLIKPVVENSKIKTWELRPIPEWQGWLPWL